MFKIGTLVLIVWGYCFFQYSLPLKVSVGMMMGGLFSMGWGLLCEKK